MIAMWIIIVLSVAALLTLYLGVRFIEPLPMGRKRKLLAWGLVGVLLFGQRLTWFVRREGGLDLYWINIVDWIGFLFLGVVSFVVVFMLARDIPVWTATAYANLKKLWTRRSARPYFKKADPGRRRFLLNASNMAIVAAALPLSGYAIYEARRQPGVVRVDLPVIDLPDGLDGFTIAQISDTHIGPTIRGEWLQGVVATVNSLKPDMIVHTGDWVDGDVASLNGAVRPIADAKAPYGTWLCTGNHEYYSGVHDWLAESRRLGMRPLVNEHVLIEKDGAKLLLAGVSDYSAARIEPSHKSSPKAAMAGAPEHDLSILLAHQPRSVFEASEAGFDIQLSGHTHGGQYFPWTYAIDLFQPYVRGLNLHDDTLLYINVGTGYWGPPMRLGAPPEITLHTLRKA